MTAQSSTSGTAVPLDDQDVLHPVLHHVNISTTRLDEMIAWYALAVGMRVLHHAKKDDFEGVWMSNDAANHRLAMTRRPYLVEDADKSVHPGLRHTAFEYDTLDGLLGTYVRLKRHGIVPDFCVDHGMTVSFYYADPDGNRVELQADCFGDWDVSSRFMLEDERFAADPVGPQVDPDAMVEARNAGATAAELHDRAYAGGFPVDEPLDLR